MRNVSRELITRSITRTGVLLCMVFLILLFKPDDSYDVCEPWNDDTEERQAVALFFIIWNSIAVGIGSIAMRKLFFKRLAKLVSRLTANDILASITSLLAFSVVTTPFVFGMVVLMNNMGYQFASWLFYSVALIVPILPSRKKIQGLRAIYHLTKYTIIVLVANLPLLIFMTSDFKGFVIPGIMMSLILYGLSWCIYTILATLKRFCRKFLI